MVLQRIRIALEGLMAGTVVGCHNQAGHRMLRVRIAGHVAEGVCRVALPERDRTRMEARFAARLEGALPSEPPARVAAAIELIKRYAEGETVDFTSVP